MIENPILPGFNPDPSFCRVGEDYYIATSTFEWYPGVQIFHSRDLANWRLVARPLDRADLLDMRGNPDSCGIWAPCLSHADGRFWLVYTDVKRYDGSFKDAHNYITTCKTIDGRWSARIHVNSSGFDPSLFHDADGRKWFVNMQWNHRSPGTGGNPANQSFDGILLQEWSETGGLIGPVTNIFPGTDRGLTEAPHLFRRGDYYYLTTAEGGTGYDHAVTLCRSREITGPYEVHPQTHLMTTRDTPGHAIQRTGHGQYVETHWGKCFHTFLMGRPIAGPDGKGRFCPLGRETGLAEVVWGDDDWLYLANGTQQPDVGLALPSGATQAPQARTDYDFRAGKLHGDFQWLRTPETARIFRCGSDGLTLVGRESIGSWFEQSLVARRQEHPSYSAETVISFEPSLYQQFAGLVTYYNRFKFHALVLTYEPSVGRVLTILSCPGTFPTGGLSYPLAQPVAVPEGPLRLQVRTHGAVQQFFWATVDGDPAAIGPELDAAVLSDEGGRGEHGSFTGNFVGMIAVDISGSAREALFQSFSYLPG
jgi:xylan 1,4-beta-xylosidase